MQDLDQPQVSPFTRRIDYKDNVNKAIALKFNPISPSLKSRFGSNGSIPRRDDKGKGIVGLLLIPP